MGSYCCGVAWYRNAWELGAFGGLKRGAVLLGRHHERSEASSSNIFTS